MSEQMKTNDKQRLVVLKVSQLFQLKDVWWINYIDIIEEFDNIKEYELNFNID